MKRRVLYELKRFSETEESRLYEMEPIKDDCSQVMITLTEDCLKGSVYDGFQVRLLVDFPSDYPFKPYQMKFMDHLVHPLFMESRMNLTKLLTSESDVICNCAACFKDNWSPALTMPQRCPMITRTLCAGFSELMLKLKASPDGFTQFCWAARMILDAKEQDNFEEIEQVMENAVRWNTYQLQKVGSSSLDGITFPILDYLRSDSHVLGRDIGKNISEYLGFLDYKLVK